MHTVVVRETHNTVTVGRAARQCFGVRQVFLAELFIATRACATIGGMDSNAFKNAYKFDNFRTWVFC